MTGEVPAREFGQCYVARQDRCGWHALVQQRIGELPVAAWTAADHRVDLGLDEQVRKALQTIDADAGAKQDGLELLAR